ncbi:GAF and ANTAR domain-containing protein [Nocardioides rubriscoriae]|uniref:GAF and ANTAR domain-containing protein n=1 Tax=Nocardioides rubriscoriae TaxID=642762 RepID=UPI0011DF2E7F|nr:GAF and ANTAR domain-containing protein [Nocardioides rubriscoriae]
MIATDKLADVFVELADSLVDDFDLVDFLQRLTDHAADMSGASSVGLLLADHHGQLQFMAASNQSGKALELFQLQHSEGPCLDCYTTGEPVVNAELEQAASRWPHFAPRAIEAGFRSVHAFPMRLRDQTIGALNLFGDSQTRFAADETRLVQALADVATIAILQERSISHAEVLTQQLQGALNSRILLEQAKGALAQREGVSTEVAFSMLRKQARSTQRRLVEVAAEVLEGL